jgi:hypothetical protein
VFIIQYFQSPSFFFKQKTMSRHCHIGVAFYSLPNFPIQWTLLLSESQDFSGHVLCGVVSETVNGFGLSWTSSTSLTTLNPMAFFLGIVYVARSTQPITSTKAMATLDNSVNYQIGSENYVVLVLLQLCKRGAINLNLPDQRPQGVSHSIRTALAGFQRSAPVPGKGYPVITL